jgi:hypothetical protein
MSNGFRWSTSALSCLSQCGEKFRRRYVENERVPPNPKLLRGRVVHEVAQHSYTRKLETDVLPTVEEAEDQAATRFENHWEEGVLFDEDDKALGEERTKGNSKDFAVDLSGYHVQKVAPAVHPIAVEERMSVTPADSDVVIHGIIDLIDLTPAGDVIRDLKTAERAPSGDAADKSLQLSMYSMLWLTDTGRLPAKLTLDTLVRTSTRNEKKYLPLHTTRDDEDMRVLIARVNAAVRTVERGDFLPAAMDSWVCNYCEFRNSCPFVRRGARPTS